MKNSAYISKDNSSDISEDTADISEDNSSDISEDTADTSEDNSSDISEDSFAYISEENLVLRINKIVQNKELSQKLAKLSTKIWSICEKDNKANTLKTPKEKKWFLREIKQIEGFKDTQSETENLEKLIENGFIEFFLPLAMNKDYDVDKYKNIELVGVGPYEDNKDVLLDESWSLHDSINYPLLHLDLVGVGPYEDNKDAVFDESWLWLDSLNYPLWYS